MGTEVIRRRRLPHWDVPEAPYFVTTCLEGSIPARGLLDLAQYRQVLELLPRPDNVTPQAWSQKLGKRAFVQWEHWLDEEPAARHLEDGRLAQIVVEALYHFAGQRYDLLAYAVMPSHFHWVFQPRPEPNCRQVDTRTSRERIVHSINRFTAQACNRVLGRKGSFWQHESYDHWVRDTLELERIIAYIENNPVKARLVAAPGDWLYSSARFRLAAGLEPGLPLLRTRN